MKLKIEYVMLFVVILGLSVYLLYSEKDQTHYQLPEPAPLSAADVTKLEITREGNSLVLNKRDDQWYIGPEDYPADSRKVEKMLDAVATLSLTAMVSESENYERYDLHPDKKIAVRAWQGTSLVRSFAIGKTAASFRHTFLTLKGDNKVYHAAGSFRNDFDNGLPDLRDKTVLSFQTQDIQQLTVIKEDGQIDFVRGELPVQVEPSDGDTEAPAPSSPPQIVWNTPEPEDDITGDKDKIERFLETLSRLSCDSYVQNAKKEDFTEPIYTVRLKGLEELSLSIYAKETEDASLYPATSSQNAYPFHLRKAQAENVMKGRDDLIETAPPEGTEE